MSNQPLSVKVTGSGPAVVCLHSSTSSSKQWRALTESLSHRFQVIAPDLYGYGDSPQWTLDRALSIEDEIALLGPALDAVCGPFHLIGHSYGAAVALALAQSRPKSVRSLTLYEPVLFNLLLENDDHSESAEEIIAVREDVRRLVREEQLAQAGARFVDYWSGHGSWAKLEPWQQQSITNRMPKVVADFDAVLGHPIPLAEYRELHIPTLLLYGVRSPKSTRTIIGQLASTLPKSEIRGFLGLGHMGPMTHAEQVATIIRKFIQALPVGILVHQLGRLRSK